MTAATQGKSTTTQLDPGKPIPFSAVYPVKASTKIYQGTLVSIDSTGYAVPASAAGTQKVVGVCLGPGDAGLVGDVDNSTGANAAQLVRVGFGAYPFVANSAITITDMMKPVYAVDDSTIDLSDSGGTRPFAGFTISNDTLAGTSTGGLIYILVGPLAQLAFQLSQGSGYATAPFKARAVRTLADGALSAYTRTAGAILENANGAIGTFDGVTLVAGDVCFLPEGVAAALADAGPWQVVDPGGASAKFSLVRPDWYSDGSTITPGSVIEMGGEGAIFGGTSWKSFVAKAKVVDTDAPAFYPGRVTVQVTLASGTFTLTSVPIRSATKTCVIPEKNASGGTVTSTTGYYSTSAGANGLTAGVLGTGQAIVQAIVAAGTVNAADNSVCNVLVVNW